MGLRTFGIFGAGVQVRKQLIEQKGQYYQLLKKKTLAAPSDVIIKVKPVPLAAHPIIVIRLAVSISSTYNSFNSEIVANLKGDLKSMGLNSMRNNHSDRQN